MFKTSANRKKSTSSFSCPISTSSKCSTSIAIKESTPSRENSISNLGERRASVARVTPIAPVERLMSVGVVERVAQVKRIAPVTSVTAVMRVMRVTPVERLMSVGLVERLAQVIK